MKNHIQIRRATLAILFGGFFSTVGAQPVVVFAASSTKNAIDESLLAYQAQSGHKAVASYAASSALARQIANGAPADLILSANQQWMRYLQDNSHLLAGSEATLTTNRLTLIASSTASVAPDLLPIRPGMPLLEALGKSERLATGDPNHVPLGQYAAAALRKLDLWQAVQPRTVPAGNARLALALVARSEALLGIVYASDVNAQSNVRQLALFGSKWHPPIKYPIAITKQSSNPVAKDLLQFLISPAGQAIFAKHGFGG